VCKTKCTTVCNPSWIISRDPWLGEQSLFQCHSSRKCRDKAELTNWSRREYFTPESAQAPLLGAPYRTPARLASYVLHDSVPLHQPASLTPAFGDGGRQPTLRFWAAAGSAYPFRASSWRRTGRGYLAIGKRHAPDALLIQELLLQLLNISCVQVNHFCLMRLCVLLFSKALEHCRLL
jgi:hypothetical protein